MNLKNIPIIFLPFVVAACVSVDSKVSENPTVYWKAPKAALPEEYINPQRIATNEILPKDKEVKTASDKIAAAEALNLTDLIDIALENNTSTRMYWFQAKIYAAQKGQVDSAYLPTLSLNASVSRAKIKPTNYGNYPAIGSFWQTGYGPTLELNWLLYDFGKREAQSLAAKEALRAANFDYNQSIQDLVLQINEVYFALYQAMGSVKASQASLEDANTAYKAADARYKEGVGNKQDALRALANAKNAIYTLESAKSSVETCRANLASVMGVEVSASLNISDEIKVPSSKETGEKIDKLMAESLKRRESILAAYAQLRSAQADTDAALRNYLPQISAVGSTTWTDYTDSPYTGLPSYNYSGGLSLSWSVFEGFNKQYQVISKKAAERAKAQSLKSAMIQVVSDVWTSYYSYQSAVKQVESSAAAVKAGEESYLATKSGYESGVNSLTDLLSAQSFLATARQQNVSANATLSVSVAKLAHATGTLFNSTPAE